MVYRDCYKTLTNGSEIVGVVDPCSRNSNPTDKM